MNTRSLTAARPTAPGAGTAAPASSMAHSTARALAEGRAARRRRRALAVIALVVATAALWVVSLMAGHTFYPLPEVWQVVRGDVVPGASFTVGELRLPRATLALLVGFAFGIAGVTFQTMLRNPLASPDVIGISSGASAAAVVCLVVLHTSETTASTVAVVAALATALTIYSLSYRSGVVGSRLILIGIGVAAMLDSVVSHVIVRASSWDLQTAMLWLTGSLNNAGWQQVRPVLLAVVVMVPVLLCQGRNLAALQQGDDSASALGVSPERTRIVVILAAVTLIAFGTAAAGPVAFVAFLAGPIAARLLGPGASLLVPAGLVGALLVLGGDLVGQWALPHRYPVGVVTGVLGAPYLVLLLIRSHRTGGSL